MRRSLTNTALVLAFLAVLSWSAADSFAAGKGNGGGKGGGNGGSKGNGNGNGKGNGGDKERGNGHDNRPYPEAGRPGHGPGNGPAWGHSINMGSRTVQFANQNYRPAYDRHSSVYRGYWTGNFGPANAGYRGVKYGPLYGQSWGYGQGQAVGLSLAQLGLGRLGGNAGYGYSPQGWGLGGWGLGSLGYSSGYLAYSNPYYVGGRTAIYNYAEPIPVSYNVVAADAPADGVISANDALNASVGAFRLADYDKALDIVDKGIRQYPDDSVLHEFRALVLFARQDFQQSAATIHSVLAVGPGWNWTTMSGLYGDIKPYTPQLRALEAYSQQNPEDSGSRFLLAYHYMIGGHKDAVAKQLTQVVRLTPSDRVAAELLRMVAPSELAVSDPAQPPPDPAAPEAKPLDPASLVGTWNASRESGAKFSLVLDKDSNFKWAYSHGNNAGSQFEGKYTMEGNVLALERRDGGSIIAQLTPDANGRINFKMVGAPSDDAGLTFTR